jgi:hypothetical protein
VAAALIESSLTSNRTSSQQVISTLGCELLIVATPAAAARSRRSRLLVMLCLLKLYYLFTRKWQVERGTFDSSKLHAHAA